MRAGRNDACPCGSGHKYKQCCRSRDESDDRERTARTSGVGAAFGWLEERFPEATDEAIEDGFYGSLGDEDWDRLEELPEHLRDLAELNAVDWLLAEGEIDAVEGDLVPAAEMVLGPGGPPLTEPQREHLEALRAAPLRLYRVESVSGDGTMTVRDATVENAVVERVGQGAWDGEFDAGDLVGARFLHGELPEPSGALYPYPADLAEDIADTIRSTVTPLLAHADFEERGRNERLVVSRSIITTWLLFLLGPAAGETSRLDDTPIRKGAARARRRESPPDGPFVVDAGTREPLLLITDRYKVLDWDRLAAAFEAEPDVVGNRHEGWVRLEPGDESPQRSLLAINLGEARDHIEPFARTLRRADEGRRWLERLAGSSISFLSRDKVDPNDRETRRRLAEGKTSTRR